MLTAVGVKSPRHGGTGDDDFNATFGRKPLASPMLTSANRRRFEEDDVEAVEPPVPDDDEDFDGRAALEAELAALDAELADAEATQSPASGSAAPSGSRTPEATSTAAGGGGGGHTAVPFDDYRFGEPPSPAPPPPRTATPPLDDEAALDAEIAALDAELAGLDDVSDEEDA